MKAGKLRVILGVAACTLLLAGCGVNEPGNVAGGSVVSPSPSGAPSESPLPTASPAPTPELLSQEVSVYLTDEQLLEMIERKVTIEFGSEEELLNKTIEALQENEEPNQSLWNGIEILSATLKKGIATIDIKIPDESRLGAPGEMMLIDSLKKTLFQFEFIDGIQLLVQGEQVESLMGHVDLEHPLKKD
ncbi:GerMN domain-containing protein [Paenibacillus agaridevorans]|uniref:GerMN domain-containing protein n=1 Tax=Paenibacillus agaridevorans TaxID=171404 RepID=UPI001BE3D56C|nr:GerMN domain-containing protein [Paenibacillus agaridevorans]